jgi:hypothetical protein
VLVVLRKLFFIFFGYAPNSIMRQKKGFVYFGNTKKALFLSFLSLSLKKENAFYEFI